MTTKDTSKLIVALLIPQAVGAIGSVFTASAIPTWYATLIRPEFAPPNWVFAPVWTTLFLLMGIAAFLVWRKGGEKGKMRLALGLFVVQLTLNALWSLVFFGLQNPAAALIEISILWLAILATIIAFSKVSRVAASLLIPYILWVSFALYLNYQFWMLNG